MVAGVLFFIHCLAHGLAISMVKASYMISVKRLSALIGIIYGRHQPSVFRNLFLKSGIKCKFIHIQKPGKNLPKYSNRLKIEEKF
jgi:hypothetical protein